MACSARARRACYHHSTDSTLNSHGHAAHRAGPTARAAITQHGLYILRGSPRHVFTPCSVSSCTPHFASRSTSSELGLHLRATLYMVTCQWGPLQPIHRLLSCLAHAGSTARSSRHVFTQRSVTQRLTQGHPGSSMLGHQRAALPSYAHPVPFTGCCRAAPT